jgi:hypothetical protein
MVAPAEQDRIPLNLRIGWALFAAMLIGSGLYDRDYYVTGAVLFWMTGVSLAVWSIITIVSTLSSQIAYKHK